MKYKLVAFWLIVFGALFAFLQMCFGIPGAVFYPSLCWGVGYCGLIDRCRGLYGWYCETDRACFGAFYPLCATDVGFAVHAFRLQLQGTGHCLLPDDDGFALWVYEDTE